MKDKSAARIYLSKWSPSSDTRKTMRQALARAARALSEEGVDPEDYPWHKLRYEDARGIAAALAEDELQPATINKCLSAVRGVLEAAWRADMMPDEVYRKIIIENVPGNAEAAGRALSSEEMSALLTAVHGALPRDAAIIAALAGAGVRRVELVRLRGVDFETSTGRLSVRGKRNKHRQVPVGDRWISYLAHWKSTLASSDDLMFEFETKNPRREVSYLIERFCREHKLKEFTPHDLRRTFITHVERVAGIATAQKLAGHESIRTTALYVRVDKAREAAAVKDL